LIDSLASAERTALTILLKHTELHLLSC